MSPIDLHSSRRFSLNPLEYKVIVTKLAGQTQSTLGYELASELLPSTDAAEIRTRLDYTDDARHFFDRERAIPSFQGIQDVREQLARAAKGGFLSSIELARLNSTLKSVRAVRRTIREAEFEYPNITRDAQRIGLFPEIEDALDHAIHPDGEVLDRASPELSRIRRDLTIERDRAERTLASMIQDFSRKGYLRETNYTLRNGRYVLPFRQDCQKNVKAIVQARSAGGATVFLEPYDLVERNNRLSELKSEEETEVARILDELSALVGSRADEIRASINTVAFLDFVFACGRLSRDWKGIRAEIGDTIRIRRARHPMIPPAEVIPVDISFPPQARVLILSGPNAGGKTVALKTIGLFALINQSGLHIPAGDPSALPVFGSIFADIGDLQSIEWNLSSFSAHIELIKRMFLTMVDPEYLPGLILLDEIGRSTDPQEGSALSLAIIEKLLELDCYTSVTTHLPAIKNLVLSADERVAGASVEFDLERAQPLYTIRVGTLGASYAIAIARRLGLDAAVLRRAEELMIQECDLLALDMPSLERRLEELGHDVSTAETKRSEALRDLNSMIVMERLMMIAALQNAERLATEAEKRLEEARKMASQLPHKIDRDEVTEELKAIRAYGDRIRRAADILAAPILAGSTGPAESSAEARLVEGNPVWILSLRREGELIELGEKIATVVIAGKRLKVPIEQLEPMRADEAQKEKKTRPKTPSHKSLPLFVDLHGLTVEEATQKLDPYLDEAYYQGRERAHVIHGFGTGKLRKGLHEWLKNHQLVEKFELADPLQGGGGVTIVTLKREK